MNKLSSIRLGLILTTLCGALAVTPAFAHDDHSHDHGAPPSGHHNKGHHSGNYYGSYRRPVYVVVRPPRYVVARPYYRPYRPVARIAGIVGLHELLHR